jgi:hypothetical protein
MYLYNYNLYNPHNNVLFSLSYNQGNPTIVDNTVFYRYSVFAHSLYEECSLRQSSHNYSEDNFAYYPMAVRYADPVNNFYVIERPPFKIDLDFSTSRSYKNRKIPKSFQNKENYLDIPRILGSNRRYFVERANGSIKSKIRNIIFLINLM